MLRIDRPVARINSSLVLYRVPHSGSFTLNSGENDDTWWYRTPSFFITIQGVTPLLSRTSCAAGNGRFWNIHHTHPIWDHVITISSSKRKNYCEGTGANKRWTYPCYRAVNTKHQQKWMRWWCVTPSKHLAKGGVTIFKVYLYFYLFISFIDHNASSEI